MGKVNPTVQIPTPGQDGYETLSGAIFHPGLNQHRPLAPWRLALQRGQVLDVQLNRVTDFRESSPMQAPLSLLQQSLIIRNRTKKLKASSQGTQLPLEKFTRDPHLVICIQRAKLIKAHDHHPLPPWTFQAEFGPLTIELREKMPEEKAHQPTNSRNCCDCHEAHHEEIQRVLQL